MPSRCWIEHIINEILENLGQTIWLNRFACKNILLLLLTELIAAIMKTQSKECV